MVKRYATKGATTFEEWSTTKLPYIAQLVGMNYDSENNVMYAGNDNMNGFVFKPVNNNNEIRLYPYINGANYYESQIGTFYDSIGNAFSTSYYVYFFYSKTTDGYVFNFSTNNNDEKLSCGWCLKTSTSSNEDSICYFGRYKESFSSDGYYTNAHSGNLATPNSVSLCNYMTNDGLFYCKNLFHSVYFPSVQTHLLFTMNGKLFSSTPANGTTAVRFVVPLDESDW